MHPSAALGSLLVAIALAVTSCAASVAPTLFGLDELISLEPDQGFLVVEVDANEAVERLAIEGTDRSSPSVTLRDLRAGRHAQLLVLPAGSYRWSEIDMKGNVTINGRLYPTTWRLDSTDDHWRFSVRPGVVNYPGVLVLIRTRMSYLRMYTLNRSAQLVQTIRESGGRILAAHRIVYSGRGRDDFLEFYASKVMGEPKQEPIQDASSAASD